MCCVMKMDKGSIGMERNTIRQSVLFGEHSCPVECITKSILFIIITTFILYMPLGDLNVFCEHTTCGRISFSSNGISPNENHAAVCCLCDIYKMMAKVWRITTRAIELLAYIIMDVLYEAKLKFYYLLESVDKRDLCRSVCCRESDVNPPNEKRVNCRCSKNKACKHKSS